MRIAALTLPLLALPTSADALGTKVWIDCRHSGPYCTEEALLAPLIDALTAAGATEIIPDTTIGESVSSGDFRLLIVIRPQADLSTPERTMYLPQFLANGGRLVLLADYEDPSEPMYNEYVRGILESRAGNPLQLNAEDLGGGCSTPPITGAGIQPDSLTAGLTTWRYARPDSVSGGTPLLQFTSSTDGGLRTLAAKWRDPSGGEIVLFGDTEGFSLNCTADDAPQTAIWSADHDALWRNLFTDESQLQDLDSDGDGFDSDVDCDDDNASAYPGADEVCNGVDDDCDTQIDEGCGDDDDDDTTPDPADDDDTTPSGDDDATDGGNFGDDDTSGSSWGDDCGCDSSAGGSLTVGAAAMLLLLGRRRSVRGS